MKIKRNTKPYCQFCDEPFVTWHTADEFGYTVIDVHPNYFKKYKERLQNWHDTCQGKLHILLNDRIPGDQIEQSAQAAEIDNSMKILNPVTGQYNYKYQGENYSEEEWKRLLKMKVFL